MDPESSTLLNSGSRVRRVPRLSSKKKTLLVVGVIAVLFVVVLLVALLVVKNEVELTFAPVVVATWPFSLNASEAAFAALLANASVVDAAVEGTSWCEEHPLVCGSSVGYGTQPNEDGETTLDAMVMSAWNVGAVANLHRVREASRVARDVMRRTQHTLLVGEAATAFALQMGYQERSLSTPASQRQWEQWRARGCQPNYWVGEPPVNCSALREEREEREAQEEAPNHDTLGLVAVNAAGEIAAASTTSGLRFRIAGRVGDAPIPGSGAYAEPNVGGCVGTGQGDLLMRMSPCARAVWRMSMDWAPDAACAEAASKVWSSQQGQGLAGELQGAFVCVNYRGQVGAAAFGMETFVYSVVNADGASYVQHTVPPELRK